MSNPKIRYIKLGFGGSEAQWCIDNHSIYLGYGYIDLHNNASVGNWEQVMNILLGEGEHTGHQKGAAIRHLNQIKTFYELTETDYFITFHQNKLWWCQPKGKAEPYYNDKNERIRYTLNSWSDKDLNGNILWEDHIDGRISQVQAFRGTICEIQESEQLLRIIKGEMKEETKIAIAAREHLQESLYPLIAALNPDDFELLTDLIFARLGWQRESVLGKTKKGVDLVLHNPISNKTVNVQIKSRCDKSELEQFIYDCNTQEQEGYFVVHNDSEDLRQITEKVPGITLWGKIEVSQLCIKLGLVDWLIKRVR
ncbi:MAG: restriction endonuclease [Lonepinella koalarum]|nr:restriction endonuclease [Lonepinella koalarum]